MASLSPTAKPVSHAPTAASTQAVQPPTSSMSAATATATASGPSSHSSSSTLPAPRSNSISNSSPHKPAFTTSNPAKEEVDDILRRKRKIREHKACYPCRQRKVKCDSQVPCQTCKDRNHADLCTFTPQKRLDTGSTHGWDSGEGPTVTIGKDDWERMNSKLAHMENSFQELRNDLRSLVGGAAAATNGDGSKSTPNGRGDPLNSPPPTHKQPIPEATGPKYVRAMEINESSNLTGENIHLGGGSVPALVNALRKGANKNNRQMQEVFGNSMLPLFGLDNESATYPFVSLWGHQEAPERISELAKMLPSDPECLNIFKSYRDAAHITFPAIAAVDTFESDLLNFLSNRRLATEFQTGITSDHMHGMHIRWIGLLFAAFASGAQFSSMPKKDRDLLSQVYMCCSFECLRIVNYLANASLEVVQTLLILGNVLANSMNAGAAWCLLGLTGRAAQSMGLHSASEKEKQTKNEVMKSKTWWAVLWQDSLFSISYDRASFAAMVNCPFPREEPSNRGGRCFIDCMYHISKVGLATVRNRVAPQSIEARLSRCVDLREEVSHTQGSAADHLRDVRCARTINDQIEYWTLYLHASYMTAELCRPAISPSTAEFDKGNQLRRLCIINLMNTVEAFLGLTEVSPIQTRSWACVHRALSSALLLGILGEPLRNPQLHALLTKLIDVMRGLAASSDSSELPAPVARSLSALNKLCAKESRTPRNMEAETSGNGNGQGDVQQGAPQFQDTKVNGAEMGGGQMGDQQQMNGGDLFQGINFDETSFFLPSPLSGFEDDSSPYALMNSIWGGGNQALL